jgi:hypothetical protein
MSPQSGAGALGGIGSPLPGTNGQFPPSYLSSLVKLGVEAKETKKNQNLTGFD